jgi:hypothetical protein
VGVVEDAALGMERTFKPARVVEDLLHGLEKLAVVVESGLRPAAVQIDDRDDSGGGYKYNKQVEDFLAHRPCS